VFARWAASIKELATFRNVYVRLGGLGMRIGGFGFHEQPEPPSSEMLANARRPYIETCIEAFGPSRAMFESNFPVDKGSYSYAVFWNACKLLAKSASNTERADLFPGRRLGSIAFDYLNAAVVAPQDSWRPKDDVGATLVVALLLIRRMGRPQGSPLQCAIPGHAACAAPPTL